MINSGSQYQATIIFFIIHGIGIKVDYHALGLSVSTEMTAELFGEMSVGTARNQSSEYTKSAAFESAVHPPERVHAPIRSPCPSQLAEAPLPPNCLHSNTPTDSTNQLLATGEMSSLPEATQ